MAISYSLHPNNLTGEGEVYRAVVQSSGTVNLESIIQRMVARGSTTTEADAYAALKDFFTIIQTLLLDGFRINTPMFNCGLIIKGNFDGPMDSFSSSRNWIEISITPGVDLRRITQGTVQTQKQLPGEARPRLLQFTDLNSGQRNSKLTPGGMAQILGDRLKFDPADPNQGIFFVGADNSESRVEVVGKNNNAELMFLIPAALTAGDYTLTVRALMSQTVTRTGILEIPLTVS
ncbi:MAG: DUF4469 domain-containing protein [Anaerolineales bacterium]|nr:DUF4469 domain-containing protein [Anaerolineales bacterium]